MSLAAAAALLAACSSPPPPVLDPQSIVDPQRYARDRYECEKLSQARGTPSSAALNGAVGGTIVGAILGVVVGAFTGHPGAGAAIGAGALGLGGLVSGSSRAYGDERTIFAGCLQGRGYSVLLP